MAVEISARLKERIHQGINGDEKSIYRVVCTLYNADNGYKYTCRYVQSLSFIQDFEKAYTDTIQASIDITPAELRELQANASGMTCVLVLYPMDDENLDFSYSSSPIIFEMKVLLSEQVDIDKKYPANIFADSETGDYLYPEQAGAMFTYTFHLIEPDAYAVRHVQLNSMFNNATMEQVIQWACVQFGAEKVKCIKPDNSMTYSNVMIPAMHDIGSLFPYLQERHGIYAKGLSYYFCDKTMYIYPKYDTDSNKSTSSTMLHLVNAPSQNYSGLTNYHNLVDNELTIVSNTKSELKNPASEGSENTGNLHVSVNAGQMLDSFITVGSDGTVTRSGDDITTLGPSDRSCHMQGDMQNMHYSGERTNIYVSTTQMAAYNGVYLVTGWNKAVPRKIAPGQCLTYHFDSQGGLYRTQKGRILSVRYTSTTHKSPSMDNWMTFTAVIAAKLDSEEESD